MGFRQTKEKVIAALRAGRIRHEKSEVTKGKNLLAAGEVTVDEVISMLQRCRGDHYSTSAHHFDPGTVAHVCRPIYLRERWYIKFFFLCSEDDEDLTVFMSVHKSVYKMRE